MLWLGQRFRDPTWTALANAIAGASECVVTAEVSRVQTALLASSIVPSSDTLQAL